MQNSYQVRKSEQMDTLGDRQTGELVAFKPHQSSRCNSCINGIEGQ